MREPGSLLKKSKRHKEKRWAKQELEHLASTVTKRRYTSTSMLWGSGRRSIQKARYPASSAQRVHCCRNKKRIVVSQREASILRKLITPGISDKAKQSINAKAITGQYNCPFLGEDGKCLVYDSRPLACSSCMVVSEPEGCEKPHVDSLFLDPSAVFHVMPRELAKDYATSPEMDLLEIFYS